MKTRNYEKFSSEIKKHVIADAVMQGDYWEVHDNEVGGSGCFIGCLARGDNPIAIVEEYGIPHSLVRLCENIFEALPEDDAKQFFSDIGVAVGTDGKDLTKVVWAFLASELRQLPIVTEATQVVIDGMDLLSIGQEWPDANTAYAAAVCAAAAVVDAAYAAADAAYAAADAVDPSYGAVAYAAARSRQAKDLLQLITDAEVS
ncbi:MAG: hypothetical protein ACKVKR_01090 [Pseudomonadales bacterium]